ncbi:hypothetical protein CBL_11226 [Carabus blaptoides fortunei]
MHRPSPLQCTGVQTRSSIIFYISADDRFHPGQIGIETDEHLFSKAEEEIRMHLMRRKTNIQVIIQNKVEATTLCDINSQLKYQSIFKLNMKWLLEQTVFPSESTVHLARTTSDSYNDSAEMEWNNHFPFGSPSLRSPLVAAPSYRYGLRGSV